MSDSTQKIFSKFFQNGSQTPKSQLNIIDIAKELGLQLDKNSKCLCPFHNDKKASLQFSEKKQIATCFSGNCDAGTMDVIELVKKFYSWDLPTAIEWLKPFAGMSAPIGNQKPKESNIDYSEIFQRLQPKLGESSKARGYLQYRYLDHSKLEVGYNTGKDWDQLKCCIIFPLKNFTG